MTHLTGFDIFTWIASFLVNGTLAIILFVRGRARSFPFFTAYILEQVVDAIVAYFVILHAAALTYQKYAWTAASIEEMLKLCVFYEVAVHVFCPTGSWARDVRKAFLVLICLSVVIAVLLTWLAHPYAPRFIQTQILRGNFFSSVLLSELCVGMVVLSGTVGLPWKTHVARIAQGLGAYSLARVGILTIQNVVGIHGGRHIITRTSHVNDSIYIACALYWVVMLWAEAPATRELPAAMKMQIYTLNRQVENDLRRIRTWRQH